MLRKITLVAFILLSVTSFYSCASGPIAGPISARHIQEMKLAKKVYISVSAIQAGSGKELPITIADDSKNILKASGFDITSSIQAADLFVKIYAEGHIIRAAYGNQPVMPHLRRTHAAGSKIFGTILFELPNKDSYIRRFSGVVEPPKKISSVMYLRPRFEKAYENSNFISTFVETLVEIHGSGIDKKIYAALESKKKEKIIKSIAKATNMLVSYRARNKKFIDKLSSYKEGLLSEEQFFKDGWNLLTPFEGLLGIVEFKRSNSLSGTNEYILGYWVPASKPESGAILDFVKDLNNTISDLNRSTSTNQFNFNLVGSTRIDVCNLKFLNGSLVSKNCK